MRPNRPRTPYWGSPDTGWPIAARWTRIWWVRPVSSITRSSAVVGSRRSISKWVRASRGSSAVDRHQLAVAPVASDRRVDRPGPRRRMAVDERQVLATQPPARQHRLQRAVDLVVLGDDQQPRGVAIEPMDDPRPRRLLATGGPPLERLRERSHPVTARRMHDHAGRLVDHQQVLVLVGDAELRLAFSDAPPNPTRSRRRSRSTRPTGPGAAWAWASRRPARGRSRSASAPAPASRAGRPGIDRGASRPRPSGTRSSIRVTWLTAPCGPRAPTAA